MGALHVVGEDLQLRLGVDLRVVREQQRVVGLLAVRLLRDGIDEHLPVEHPMRRFVEDALVQLPAGAPFGRMVHEGLVVAVLVAAEHVEPVEARLAAAFAEGRIDIGAREPRADGERERMQDGCASLRRLRRRDVERVGRLALQLDVLDVCAFTKPEFGHGVGEVAAAADCREALDDRHLRVAADVDANLVINPKINISVQPVNTTICEDNIAIFSLNATGTNLTYKWKYNEAYISDNGRITGATTNELKIAFAANGDEGIYKCQILSTCGTKETNSVILTVDDSTAISIHPINQTIVQGSTASFSILATGIITGYQWQKDGVDLINGVNITGANSTILTVAVVGSIDAGSYRCIVTGKCGTLSSNLGILTVNVPVSITTQPVSQTKCSGESASFSVIASGTIQSYQWKLNGSNLADGANISGAQTSNLIISSVDISHAGLYTCIVTGNSNIANSNGAVLTINEPAVITTHPITQTVCEGDWLVLEVVASGAGVTYQWEKDNIVLTPNPSTTGINSSLLVITNVASTNAGSYRCTISNTCKTEKSNPAIVTINPKVSFVTQPVNDTKCEGQTTSFSVIAAGVNIQYQWFKNGVALSNTGRITGVNTRVI